MEKPENVGLHFGAGAGTVADQLTEQGFAFDAGQAEHWQKDSDAITRLHLRGFITDAAAHRARQKLTDKVALVLQFGSESAD